MTLNHQSYCEVRFYNQTNRLSATSHILELWGASKNSGLKGISLLGGVFASSWFWRKPYEIWNLLWGKALGTSKVLLITTNNILMLIGKALGRNKTDCVPLDQTVKLEFGVWFWLRVLKTTSPLWRTLILHKKTTTEPLSRFDDNCMLNEGLSDLKSSCLLISRHAGAKTHSFLLLSISINNNKENSLSGESRQSWNK